MRRYKTQVQILVIVLALSLLTACALFNQTTKPLTAKQQATLWMALYNSTYDSTMAMAKNPAATPTQKDMVAKKKAILTPMWPLLKVYVDMVDTGGTPSAESVRELGDLVDELASLVGGR